MTNWRAVAVGFVLLVVIGTAGLSMPAVGQLGAGLVGGFAAGYLAGGGPGSGAWHGLVAGFFAGFVVAVVVAFVGATAGGALGALVGGFSVLVSISAVTLLLAADGAVAGAVGGWFKRRTA